MNELAIHGGPRAKPTPFARPNRYGEEDLAQLREVIESGRLMGPGGKIREFEEAIEKAFGVKHAIMVSSGTAAIHTALAALGVVEGDEVITTPMTDMGTVIPILAQHAVPIFADINLVTRLICADSIRGRITRRTKAIIAIHSAGMPCDMDALLKISEETGVKILEDCAQAHGAKYKGRFVGTMGHVAGFRDKAYDRSGLPRGTAEQWIKEGKYAVKWPRLSCHDFRDNEVRLQLFALAYNLANFVRRLALPRSIRHWSLTTLRENLIRIGAKVVRHARYVMFEMAEVAIPRRLFATILRRIGRLCPVPL